MSPLPCDWPSGGPKRRGVVNPGGCRAGDRAGRHCAPRSRASPLRGQAPPSTGPRRGRSRSGEPSLRRNVTLLLPSGRRRGVAAGPAGRSPDGPPASVPNTIARVQAAGFAPVPRPWPALALQRSRAILRSCAVYPAPPASSALPVPAPLPRPARRRRPSPSAPRPTCSPACARPRSSAPPPPPVPPRLHSVAAGGRPPRPRGSPRARLSVPPPLPPRLPVPPRGPVPPCRARLPVPLALCRARPAPFPPVFSSPVSGAAACVSL